VLYIEPRAYLKPTLRRWRQGQLGRSDLCRPRLTTVQENLYVYRPPALLPISGRPPLSNVLDATDRWMVRRVMKRLGLRSPLVWLSRPSMISRVGQFDALLTIYHVVDEYTAYAGEDEASREIIRRQERSLTRLVDLIVVVSENLLNAKRPLNPHTYLVPNGVDYPAYARVMDSDEPPPADIAGLPRPRIGYSGLIAARLDLALLRSIAVAHPEWSLVLVGAVDARHAAPELATLQRMPNVHFLGVKDIAQVPRYVRAFDVCLIPYAVNERAQHASPLKLYDYLAAGKPIVTTAFAAAEPFRDVVSIVDSREAFVRGIEQALSETNGHLAAQRRRIAAENTWEQRAEQLSAIVQSCLAAHHH
jgi:glycosyltransferase involved in cell wall biosynthesis